MNQEEIKAIQHIFSHRYRKQEIPTLKNRVKVYRVKKDILYNQENPAKRVNSPKIPTKIGYSG